jgi:hypothetical protein
MSRSLQLVTVGQLRDELTAAELSSIPGAVFGEDETPAEVVEAWLSEHLLQASDRVVAAINSCSRNTSIMTGLCKVPAACVRTVLVLARHAVISAIPGLSETLEGSTRSAEYNTATQDLQRLASCEFVPDYTLSEEESVTSAGNITLMLGEPKSDFLF